MALLGLCCPLVATLRYNGLPVIAAWNGRSWERSVSPEHSTSPGLSGEATVRASWASGISHIEETPSYLNVFIDMGTLALRAGGASLREAARVGASSSGL